MYSQSLTTVMKGYFILPLPDTYGYLDEFNLLLMNDNYSSTAFKQLQSPCFTPKQLTLLSMEASLAHPTCHLHRNHQHLLQS